MALQRSAARYITLKELQRDTTRSIKHLIGEKKDRLHQPTLYGNLELGNGTLPVRDDRLQVSLLVEPCEQTTSSA